MTMDPLVFWSVSGAVALVAVSLTIFNAKHWKGSKNYLCDDCKYNNPTDCLKPERPTAVDCTAYRPST